MGLLAGSGAAIVTTALLLFRGWPAMLAAQWCMIAGLVLGIAWGIVRRPGKLRAAIEADRQLGLDELLSSAWLIARSAPSLDPWSRTILAHAQSRCQPMALRALRLRRLGPREWGGIALAVGFSFALAGFGPSPAHSRGLQIAGAISGAADGAPFAANHPLLDLTQDSERQPVLLQDPDDPNASNIGQNTASDPSQSKPSAGHGDDSQNKSAATSGDQGHGAGSARTSAPPDQTANTVARNNEPPQPAPPARSTAGEAAAGSGTATGNTRDGHDAAPAGGGSRASAESRVIPPWNTAQWSADVERAGHAITSGRVPTAYRDLVRRYFSREAAPAQ